MLIQGFFDAYFSGNRPLDALRIAQRAMQATSKWNAPYFWAGFVIEGGRPTSGF